MESTTTEVFVLAEETFVISGRHFVMPEFGVGGFFVGGGVADPGDFGIVGSHPAREHVAVVNVGLRLVFYLETIIAARVEVGTGEDLSESPVSCKCAVVIIDIECRLLGDGDLDSVGVV